MRTLNMNEPFTIKNGENVFFSQSNLHLKLNTVSRLRVPRGPEQFLLTLSLEWNHFTEDVGKDGDFRFPNPSAVIQWKKFRIQIENIDFMANFATLNVHQSDE